MVFGTLMATLALWLAIPAALAVTSREMSVTASPTLPSTVTRSSNIEIQPYVTWNQAANQDVVCPEQIGGELWYCWDHWCRGEDVTKPGHCYKINPMGYQCQCKPMPRPDGNDASMTTLTTKGTLWGTPTDVTLTYALETLAAYTPLRKHKITTLYNPFPMTTTATSTTTTANVGLGSPAETVVAVIAAGGTIWMLLEGWIGPAEAIMAELGPGDLEEGDDPACPVDYDHNCADPLCLGQLRGMCTVGDSINCPCIQCPDKADLFCDVEECSGVSGQCTKPGWAECACTYRPCPGDTSDGAPKCDDAKKCGGPAGEGPVLSWTCKGLDDGSHADKRLYQECVCQPYDGPEPLVVDASESDINATINILRYLPAFTEDSWPIDTTLKVANSSCSLSSPQVLRIHNATADIITGLDTFYEPFCDENHGRLISEALVDARLSNLTLVDNINWGADRTPVWFSVRPWDDRPASHKCDIIQGFDNFTLNAAECKSAFALAASNCDPDNAYYSKGGSMPGYCLVYEIVTEETYDELSPPWSTVYTEEKLPQCGDDHKPRGGDDGIGLKRDFWGCMATKFCSDPTNFDGTNHKYSTKDFQWELGCNRWENLEQPDNITATPYYPQSKYGNDYTFTYQAKNLTDPGCDKSRCQNSFNHFMYSSCGVSSPTYDEMVPSGSIKELFGCGEFEYTIEPPETFDVSCTLNETDYPNTPEYLQPSEFKMTEVEQLIDDFCFGNNTYIPHPLPAGREDPTYPQLTRQVGGEKGPFVRLEQVFAVDRAGGALDPEISTACLYPNPVNNSHYGGDRCVKIFTAAINQCNGGDGNAEIPGAWAFEHEDPNGCVVYTISAFYWHKRGGKYVAGLDDLFIGVYTAASQLWRRAMSWLG
ncbi:hypothetical protein B0T21DRAFT_431828 [Apiosordaria backusii]|uniref:C-type lectin domain-containing protein n=1 Tax=Apiosordaria backusii TaxID=314023 RepID=A0AA39ZRY5_9PEZI|nr:hypothetical protein B0T21DRAFT_431828 [Apiosordaria backusii]